MKIQRTIKLNEEFYKWIEKQAEENCRSFAGQIEFMTKQEIRNSMSCLTSQSSDESERQLNVVE